MLEKKIIIINEKKNKNFKFSYQELGRDKLREGRKKKKKGRRRRDSNPRGETPMD